MAHFAKIDSNNKVETVIVAPDQAYVDSLGGRWIQTSYNTLAGVHYDPITGQPSADQSKALRKNFAGIGANYDESRDAFISDQPYPSWTLNETSCIYEPPVAIPTIWTYATDEREDEIFKFTDWDEPNLRWIAIKQDDTNIYWDPNTTSWVSY
jgi:hypothetical protein|tara:strand:+ start:1445 stop:1903 length:459 start_codon:yes stop_codon:yes gene_type:complete